MYKNLLIKNNSHYFSNTSPAYVEITNPYTYSSSISRQFGYQVRAFHEFNDVKRNGLFCAFLTLTYNNNALPRIFLPFGNNCDFVQVNSSNVINRDDFVWLYRDSGLRDALARENAVMRFLCTTEMGDGKGSRGFGNNPHFHLLAFLYPKDKTKPSTLHPAKFKRLVKRYWQGTARNPQDFKYGLVQEGKFGVEVTDLRAINYVTKYVCKSIHVLNQEKKLLKDVKIFIRKRLNNSVLFKSIVFSLFNLSPKFFFNLFETHLYSPQVNEFIDNFIDRLYNNVYKKFLNKYRSKVMVSRGFGDYGLNFITQDYKILFCKLSKLNKPQYSYFNLPSYYARKLFYDVEKDVKGNRVYVLNECGMLHRSKVLNDNLNDLYMKVSNVLIGLNNDDYDYLNRIYGVSVSPKYVQSLIYPEYIQRYCLYKYIYEFRPIIGSQLKPSEDYCSFLNSSFKCSRYYEYDDPERAQRLNGIVTYASHPAFIDHIKNFELFDYLLDVSFYRQDEALLRQSLDRDKVRKWHNEQALILKYSTCI